MKAFFKLLLAASAAILLSTTIDAKSDEYPIPIIIEDPGSGENRSPEQVPFLAQVWDHYVVLGCTSNIGSVEIRLTSTTGDDYETVFDTSFGSIIIPISGLSGLYRLDIVLPSGQSYYGEFVL